MVRQVSRGALLGGLVAALATGGFLVTVSAQSPSGVIYGCIQPPLGGLRIVPAGTSCRAGESPVQWNITGPAGPAGPQGPQGPPGSSGPSELQVAGSLWVYGMGSSDIYALSWGASQPESTGGAGGATGRVDVRDLVVRKGVDGLTSGLLTAAVVGQHIREARVEFFTAGTTSPLVRYELDDVLIGSVSFVVHGERVVESVSLRFGRIKTTVFLPDGTHATFCWDLIANRQC